MTLAPLALRFWALAEEIVSFLFNTHASHNAIAERVKLRASVEFRGRQNFLSRSAPD